MWNRCQCDCNEFRNRCNEDRRFEDYRERRCENEYDDEAILEEKLMEMKRRRCREIRCISEFERCLRHIRCR